LADSIYWTNSGDNTVRVAPLAGGGPVDTLYGSAQGVDLSRGLAIDPSAGRIYWANVGDDTIRRAPLAGGGAVDTLYGSAQGVSGPFGVAIDPAAGWIYWSNGGDHTIRRAPLAGGGTVNTLYDSAQGVFSPTGVVTDPATGRIYWSDGAAATICGAPLAGGGTVETLYGSAQGVLGPLGVAIDRAAGRICWSNRDQASGTIQGAPLAVGGTVNTLYDNAHGVSVPEGVAIDPNPAGPAPERLKLDTDRFDIGRWDIGRWFRDLFSPPSASPARIYWSNGPSTRPGQQPNPSDNTIRGAPLAGGGTVDTLYGSAQGVSSPTALALLRPPLGAGAPAISWSLVLDDGRFGGLQFGGSHSGPLNQRLTCTRGTWAADLPGSHLYRAPQSFAYQWRLGGNDIGGATSADYTPTASGTYTCRVTASNRAGSAAQTSAAVTTVP
jgi:hypothetical protein